MKVLVFTVSAGNGHNSTAKRIKEKILEENPNAEIEIVDVYKSYTGKFKQWTMEKGYFFVCRHFVGLYNHFFKKSEKCNYSTRDTAKVNKEVNVLLYGMLNKIYEYKPDLIVSTYIFCAVALRNLRRYYKIPAKIMCMTLDYGISPYWECCAEGLDYMFLTNESMVEPFKEKGYKDEQLFVTGIPVAKKFSNPYTKEEASIILGLDSKVFTICVMKASFFPVKNKQLVKELAKVKKPIQLIFINGKDEKGLKQIDKYVKKYKLQHKVVNVGFTDKVVEYFSASDMILGKAGGLTTTESINTGVPSLILGKLPQQEIYNKKFLVDNGCAISITNKTIGQAINNILDNKDEYNRIKDNCLKLRITDTIDRYYEVISKVPVADYSGIELKDNKRQVIKNVTKCRKESIKKQKNSK